MSEQEKLPEEQGTLQTGMARHWWDNESNMKQRDEAKIHAFEKAHPTTESKVAFKKRFQGR